MKVVSDFNLIPSFTPALYRSCSERSDARNNAWASNPLIPSASDTASGRVSHAILYLVSAPMKLSRRHFIRSSLLLTLPAASAASPLSSLQPSFDVVASHNSRVPGNAPLPRVSLMRTPDHGIQPQVAVDNNQVVHLVYFKGDPAAGDVFYVRKTPREARLSGPIRVNSISGSVIALGSVRGAQIAVGKGGRPHVAWLGSAKAEPRGPGGAIPMLYTRLNDAGSAFEPQRNVMQFATGLDGGGSIAADSAGNVYVAWHANPKANGETHRRVYLARSADGGKTFRREVAVSPAGTGACGCCGMRAFADHSGNVYILYRTATALIHRDMQLLISEDHGHSFSGRRIAKWTIDACPMSTASICQGGSNVFAAWETSGDVYYDQVHPPPLEITTARVPSGSPGDRKHPAVAANGKGETLLAWTEGTAWGRGGSVAWQLFDRHGLALGRRGRAPGLPVWDLVAAFALPDGGFTVVY